MIKINAHTILTNRIFLFIAAFSMVKPESLPYIGLGWLNTFLIGFDFFIIMLLMLNITQYKISLQSVLIILMYSVMAMSTLLNYKNAQFYYLVKAIGTTVASCLLMDYCMQCAPKKYISTMTAAFSVMLIINAVTVYVFPTTLYKGFTTSNCWFLGFDNGFIYYMVAWIGYAMINLQLEKTKRNAMLVVCAIVISLLTVFKVWAVTGMLSLLFLVGCIIMSKMSGLKKIMRPSILIAVFYLGTVLLVFFRVQYLFENLIVNILHKNLNIGREYLWDVAISIIKNHPIIGVGQTGVPGSPNAKWGFTPHCLILDMLYKGGFFMFGIFVLILHRFSKHIKSFLEEPLAIVLLICTATILFSEIANSVILKPYFWTFIAMSSHLPCLVGTSEQYNKEFIHFKLKRISTNR